MLRVDEDVADVERVVEPAHFRPEAAAVYNERQPRLATGHLAKGGSVEIADHGGPEDDGELARAAGIDLTRDGLDHKGLILKEKRIHVDRPLLLPRALHAAARLRFNTRTRTHTQGRRGRGRRHRVHARARTMSRARVGGCALPRGT
eukprot:3709019-Pleurochrysis_carterae.AAC.2